jgi:uncharacterized membrane protein
MASTTMERATAQPDRAPGATRADAKTERRRAPHTNVGDAERLMSVVGGGVLAAYGVKRGDTLGLLAGLVGATVLQRGVTGHCQVYGALGVSTAETGRLGGRRDVELFAAATVQAEPDELFRLWRNPLNLPRFMSFLEGVEPLSDRRAHWRLDAPLGRTLAFDVEVLDERQGEFIRWETVDESVLRHQGEVRFRRAPAGRGTEVELRLDWFPPGGTVGAALASVFDGAAEMKLRADLKRFKQWVETGEIATTEGQPSGRGTEVGD